MNFKRLFVFLIILLVGISIVSAVDTSDVSTDTMEDTVAVSSVSDEGNLVENTYNKEVKHTSNLKKDSRTIVLNSTSFDDYVSDGKFNDNITDGDTVDVQGLLDGTHFGLTVDKPVNIISSTNDAYIGADTPIGFTISSGGSGTNITGIHFHNVHFVVQHASNIFINNITVETGGQLVGSGQGVTSIREDSSNITVNNSYFKSDNNLGVSTLVCAVAQDVLIENCTIEGIGFVGNLVYFTTYNVDYDHSRGYGNRNITFRNNHIIGLDAIQQSICYGLTMEGIGHTIENNVIEYGYYCIQQQANVDNNDQVSRIIIRNNTIPYGMNIIAYAQVENNTFNNIEQLRYCNFTDNTANNVNVTATSNIINSTINLLELKSDNVNMVNDTITSTVILTNGKSYNMSGMDNVKAIDNVVIIGYYSESSYNNYASLTDGLLSVNKNIPDNSYVIINSTMFTFKFTKVNISSSVNNAIIKINPNNIENITVEGNNITITDTNVPFGDISSTGQTKLVNSAFFSTDTINNFILENSTIYTNNENLIVFDSDNYENIFDSNTNTLLDTINENSTLLIRNKSASGEVNNYNRNIIINKPVIITSLDNTIYDANITFIDGSLNSNISSINVTGTVTINEDGIAIENNTLNTILINNSNNNLIANNKFKSDTTAIKLINSNNNNIYNNSINTQSTYTIELDNASTDNNITSNKLQSMDDYTNYTINADFTTNNIANNTPAPYPTTINLELPSRSIISMPTHIGITVSYYRDVVTNGYVVILVNGVQKNNITLVNGHANTDITFDYDGTNTVKVWYFADEYYQTSSTSKNVTASKINTNLEFTETTSAKVGENFTVTVKVTDEYGENVDDGIITLTIKNDTFDVEIVEGIATANITSKESYMSSQISAYYAGTPTRYEKTITKTLTITKGDAVINVIKTRITDDVMAVTVKVSDINGIGVNSGKVRYKINDGTYTSLTDIMDTITFNITPVPESQFKFTVDYRSNPAFNNKNENFTLNPENSQPIDITITLMADNTKIGEELTLMATVIDQYHCNVNDMNITFLVDNEEYNATITDGLATYTKTTDESWYNKPITATTQANDDYNQATSNTIYLDKGDVILTLTQEEINDNIHITATVTDINNNQVTGGNIIFSYDGNSMQVSLTDSTATYEVSSDIQQDATVTATFQDNDAFNIKTEEITISAKEPQLKVDTKEFTVGNSTIRASIYRGNLIASNINSGKVTFKVNGKTLKDTNGKVIYAKVINGTATIENYQVPESWITSNTTIQAIYSGSSQLSSLKSDKETITVNKANVKVLLSDMTATQSETIQIRVQVTYNDVGVNTGKVVVKVNGKTLKDTTGKVIYAQVVDGEAVVNYTIPDNLKAKTYTLTAVFTSGEYARTEETKTLTVTA